MAENRGIARPYAEAVFELARESGNLDQDPLVAPGDVIWVPEGFF